MKGKAPTRRAPALEPDQKKQLVNVQRRLLLRSGLTLGGVAMLTGCNMQDGDQVDKVLWAMSRWNDRVQSWLFSGQRLAYAGDCGLNESACWMSVSSNSWCCCSW